MDDKNITILLDEDQITLFFEAIKKNETFWDAKHDTAFWTPAEQIRYTSISKYDDKATAEAVPEVQTEEVPEVIYEGFLDDDYPKALDNYIENLSIDQVPDDFISSRYDKEMDNY